MKGFQYLKISEHAKTELCSSVFVHSGYQCFDILASFWSC